MMRAMTKTITAGLAALALGLFAAGCGDDDKSSEGGESEGAKTACKADALSGDSGLPAAFPIPGELTLTETSKDGPSTIVDGYWASGLDEAYEEYKPQVEAAGYTVTFTEKEEADAEIAYTGDGKSGIIALRADCSEGDETTRVHITNRPA
jgi:hypothetical protein